jgi:hypothetical protein
VIFDERFYVPTVTALMRSTVCTLLNADMRSKDYVSVRNIFQDSLPLLAQRCARWQPRKPGVLAKFPFDGKQPVVFCDALAAAKRAGLDLATACANSKIGDERVLGFPRSMRDDSVVTRYLCKRDAIQRFRDGPNLIELDEDGVGDALREYLWVGYEIIVADNLDFFSELACEQQPAFDVVFRHSVFERYDRVFFDEIDVKFTHAGGCTVRPIGLCEDVFAIVEKLARRWIKSNCDIRSGLITGINNCLHYNPDRFFVVFQIRREATFVAYRSGQAFRVQNGFKFVKYFRAKTQGLGETWRTGREEHELLKIDVVGVHVRRR